MLPMFLTKDDEDACLVLFVVVLPVVGGYLRIDGMTIPPAPTKQLGPATAI